MSSPARASALALNLLCILLFALQNGSRCDGETDIIYDIPSLIGFAEEAADAGDADSAVHYYHQAMSLTDNPDEFLLIGVSAFSHRVLESGREAYMRIVGLKDDPSRFLPICQPDMVFDDQQQLIIDKVKEAEHLISLYGDTVDFGSEDDGSEEPSAAQLYEEAINQTENPYILTIIAHSAFDFNKMDLGKTAYEKMISLNTDTDHFIGICRSLGEQPGGVSTEVPDLNTGDGDETPSDDASGEIGVDDPETPDTISIDDGFIDEPSVEQPSDVSISIDN